MTNHFELAEGLLKQLTKTQPTEHAVVIAATAQAHATLATIQQQALAVDVIDRQVAVQEKLLDLASSASSGADTAVMKRNLEHLEEHGESGRQPLTWVIAWDKHSAIAACVGRGIKYGLGGDAFGTRIRTTPRSLHGASPHKGDRVLYADPSEATLAEWEIACTSLDKDDLEVIE